MSDTEQSQIICIRDGCTNPLGYRQVRYCSNECLRAGQDTARPVCQFEGCDEPVARSTRKWRKYCSDEHARPYMRGVCGTGRHPKPDDGRCKLCRQESRERYEQVHRRVGQTTAKVRPRSAVEAGRSKPPPPPAPVPIVDRTERGPAQVWRPAGLDRWAAWGGPGDPATRRGESGVAGDATPVGVSASAADTVDPEELGRSA